MRQAGKSLHPYCLHKGRSSLGGKSSPAWEVFTDAETCRHSSWEWSGPRFRLFSKPLRSSAQAGKPPGRCFERTQAPATPFDLPSAQRRRPTGISTGIFARLICLFEELCRWAKPAASSEPGIKLESSWHRDIFMLTAYRSGVDGGQRPPLAWDAGTSSRAL